MLCIESNKTDPYFNLAAEEYLLKNKGAETCMLWRSLPAAIAGKHQNILSEINYPFAVRNKIKIARRLTGGGTVYHDMGNLNFSFIRNAVPGKLIEFQKHIHPVVHFLKSLGIKAFPGPKNEILVDEGKISGNAEHIYKQRVLHHGTLLFDTDLNILNKVITREGGIYNDKAVQSNRSDVINLKEYMPQGMTMAKFMHDLNLFFLDYFHGEQYFFSNSEINTIQELADSKYNTWKWNFGWSPDYEFRNNICTDDFKAHICIKTHRGVIREFSIVSDKLSSPESKKICKAFKDIPHSYDAIQNVLYDLDFNSLATQGNNDDFIFGFF